MKVILLENMRNVGKLGDVATVAAGYARNYLLPYGKALPATAVNVSLFEQKRSELEAKAKERFDNATARADAVKSVHLKFVVQASPEGKLFGSIKASDILQRLIDTGHQVAKHEVRLEQAIREVGQYTYELHFHPECVVTMNMTIESEQPK
jgi:large subunit ribosomal protein L9